MALSVDVRPATSADVEGLTALWADLAASAGLDADPDSLQRRVAESLTRSDVTTLVAEDGERLLGFVNFAIESNNPLVDTPALVVSGMHVSDHERRKGVGAALLQGILSAAEESGATEVTVTVPPEMRAANRYLAKLGFAPVLVRRSTTTTALRARLTPSQTRTRRAVLRARRAARQPVTAVGRVLQSQEG